MLGKPNQPEKVILLNNIYAKYMHQIYMHSYRDAAMHAQIEVYIDIYI